MLKGICAGAVAVVVYSLLSRVPYTGHTAVAIVPSALGSLGAFSFRGVLAIVAGLAIYRRL